MENIFRIYDSIIGNEVAYLFSSIIVFWLAIAIAVLVVPSLTKKRSSASFVSITPNSLATLGVLGTFTGILIGLLDFDVENASHLR